MHLINSALALFGVGVAALGMPALAQTQWSGNGHYYQIVASPGIDWNTADTTADGMIFNGLPGHLVTITSAAEDAFVSGLIAAGNFGELWAGGYQNPPTEPDPKAGWMWVDGEGTFPGSNSALPYAAWAPGEPNDFFGLASEQFLALNRYGPNAGWNDEGYAPNISGYVVEYQANQAVPDGASTLWLLASSLIGFCALRLGRKETALESPA